MTSTSVAYPPFTGARVFENFSILTPSAQQEDAVIAMLDQVVAWGRALRPLRK
ncbi:hypothetical protein [Nonomuraea sp. NPDC050691]|uniref:hypothetical protein n=1 Tax=Nonomuraea sp. NPDC050691 TaxID=3155661 RepID=UPI0033F6DD27